MGVLALVIVFIIGVVAIMFFSDLSKTGRQIEAQGGMETKYAVLIERFLATPGTRIGKSRSKSTITLIGETSLFHHTITIVQINDRVRINWLAYNTWGKFPKEWEFNEWDDQLDMVYRMSKEMNEHLDRVFDQHAGMV